MVRLNKIYTRTGDDGTTGLGNGERRSKADARVESYGTVDELNAVLGLARLHATGEVDALLARIRTTSSISAPIWRPPKPASPCRFSACRSSSPKWMRWSARSTG